MPPPRAPPITATASAPVDVPGAPDEGADATLEGGFTLSDSDVQILYEILRLAQDSPFFTTQPFHAIFPAYRDVLAHHDITTSNDRTYLRFLYKLEQRRAPAETLFETFETRLAQLGIELRFSSEDGDGEDEPRVRVRPSATEIAEDARDWRPRERRASFSSFVDFEETARPRPRAGSRGSVSRLQDLSDGFGAQMPTVGQRRHLRQSAEANLVPRKLRDQLREPARPLARQDVPRTPPARRDQPRRIKRTGWREPESQIFDDNARAGSVTSSVPSEDSRPLVQQDESLHLPSETQLLRDAATFDFFRMRDLARQLLRQWRDKAVQHQWESDILLQRADQLYEESLVRRTFERVRDMYRLRKHLRRAEEVYTLWEERARKARDNYLVTKAFTHWEACTAEERERSAFARRHVLRVKFFNAWREVTAVNKLKAQQQVLGKFFDLWKQKFVRTWIHENKAVTLYDDRLTESTYWRWFWRFCEERAPQWREAVLKRRYLRRMIEALVSKKERENQVTTLRDQELQYRFFGRWRNKQREVERQEGEALEFQRTQTIARALPQWQRQLKLARPARQVAQMVRTRVVAGVFRTWLLKTQMSLQAKRVNEVRIMQNAWTTWNDRLRIEVMRHQIDDRVAVQALYKWVLVEREVLLKRLHKERLMVRALETVKARYIEVTGGLASLAEQLAIHREQRLKRSIIQKWCEQTHFRQDQNARALQHYESQALRHTMRKWHAKHDHETELARWAVEALYYVRASRTIKLWQTGVTERKKRKIQAAYAAVRVEQKKKQATGVLQLLRDRMRHAQELETAADMFYDQNTKVLLSQLLAKWFERLEEVQEFARSADRRRTEVLLSDAVATWSERAQLAQHQQAQSTSLATMHVEKIAYEGLRKLQLRSLELQNLSAKAVTIRSWNSKRHARKLLRLWQERTAQKRNPDTVTPSFLRTGPPRIRALPSELSSSGTLTGMTPRQAAFAESEATWSPPVGRVLDTSPPMSAPALPGYLSTPSKRAARARAIVGEALSFTPATDPRAMRRAQALLYSDITEEDTGESILEQPDAGPESLTRTLFRRSQRLGFEGRSRGGLQSLAESRARERSSRMGGSLIPRSTLFQERRRQQG